MLPRSVTHKGLAVLAFGVVRLDFSPPLLDPANIGPAMFPRSRV